MVPATRGGVRARTPAFAGDEHGRALLAATPSDVLGPGGEIVPHGFDQSSSHGWEDQHSDGLGAANTSVPGAPPLVLAEHGGREALLNFQRGMRNMHPAARRRAARGAAHRWSEWSAPPALAKAYREAAS